MGIACSSRVFHPVRTKVLERADNAARRTSQLALTGLPALAMMARDRSTGPHSPPDTRTGGGRYRIISTPWLRREAPR